MREIIIGIFLLIFAILLFPIMAYNAHKEDKLFKEEGKRAQIAQIEKYSEVTRTHKGLWNSSTKSYTAEICYGINANKPVCLKAGISDVVLDKSKMGIPVYVRYLPSNPKKYRFEGAEPSFPSYIKFGAALYGIPCLLLTFYMLGSNRRRAEQALARQYIPVLARKFGDDAPVVPTVLIDDQSIHLQGPNDREQRLRWCDVTKVTLSHVATNPSAERVLWNFYGQDGDLKLRYPQSTYGAKDAIISMKSILKGFDEKAMMQALSASLDIEYVIWNI